MIKYFLVFFLIVLPLFSKTIGAIAMTVNGDPITLYEINQLSKRAKISKEDAVNALVQEKIEEEEMRKQGIYASPE